MINESINPLSLENTETVSPIINDDIQVTLLDMRYTALVKRVESIETRLISLNSKIESIESGISSLIVD